MSTVASDLVAYVAGVVAGLSTAAPANIFDKPFPLEAPERAVCIFVHSGEKDSRGFGGHLAPSLGENPHVIVMARDSRNAVGSSAEALANSVYAVLNNAGPLVLGGVTYLDIHTQDGPPKFSHYDENQRAVYWFTVAVSKRVTS